MAGNGNPDGSWQGVSRRRVLRSGAVAGALGLAGCAGDRGNGGGNGNGNGNGGGGTTPGGNGGGGGDTIRMVQFAPLSGPYSYFGEYVRQGGEMAAKQINEDGGINGKELQLEFADSETDPNATVQKAKQFNNEGVQYFLHGVSSAVGAALQGWATNNDAFVTINGDGATTITGEDCVQNGVRVNRNVSMGAFSLGVFAEDQYPDVSDYYFLGADYNWGHTGVQYGQQVLKDNGNNISGESFAPLGTKDFSTYINKIQNSGASGLFCVISGSDFIRFMNQADSVGLLDELDIMLCTNAGDIDTSKELGSMATGVASTTRWYFNADYGTDGQEQFNQTWRDEYGTVPRAVGENAWAGLWMNKLVMDEAGSTKVSDILEAYPGFEWTSGRATIPRSVRKCDHQAKQPIFVGELTETSEYDFPILEGQTYDPAEHKLIRTCEETGCNLG